jgi:acyl-CoA thioesterase-1
MKPGLLCLAAVLAWNGLARAGEPDANPTVPKPGGTEATRPATDAAKSRLATNLKAGKNQTIVACGTSLTASGCWVKPFQAALERSFPGLTTVVNSGVSGSCSQWLVKNLDEAVIKKKPDTVIIEYGINDCVPRFNYSTEELKTNLEAIVKRILQANPNCEIVLMTMTPGNGPPEGDASYRKNIAAYYQVYRDVAKGHGFSLVDTYPIWKSLMESDKALYQKYCPDTIHESDEGGRKVIVPEVLKTLGIEVKPAEPPGQPDRGNPAGAKP